MDFLFVNNYKREKNDGPNKDVHEFKYCLSTLTNTGYGSLRPPNDDSYSEDWRDNLLEQSNDREKTSFKQYCMKNWCTHEDCKTLQSTMTMNRSGMRLKKISMTAHLWQRYGSCQ